MTATELIAKSLNVEKALEGYNVEKLEGKVCLFSGLPIDKGVHVKKALSGNFTDFDACKGLGSEYVGLDVMACLKQGFEVEKDKFTELRKYSFLATEKGIEVIRTANLLECLLKDKPTPFVFCFAMLRAQKAQKHLSFKSQVNYQNDVFTVTTECGDILFDRSKAKEVLPIIEAWYSITDDTKGKATTHTYFNKDEILNGCQNLKRIEKYGVEKYYTENAILQGYRGQLFFELLVRSLQKDEQDQE